MITHEQARESAQRLINSHFGNKDQAVTCIPASKGDDDVVIMDYIKQQSAIDAEPTPGVEYFRTKLMQHFSNDLSMDKIANCAYELAGQPIAPKTVAGEQPPAPEPPAAPKRITINDGYGDYEIEQPPAPAEKWDFEKWINSELGHVPNSLCEVTVWPNARLWMDKCARAAVAACSAQKYEELSRWKKAVEGLTPSGSEFVDDPERCAAFIRQKTNYPKIVIDARERIRVLEVALREVENRALQANHPICLEIALKIRAALAGREK